MASTLHSRDLAKRDLRPLDPWPYFCFVAVVFLPVNRLLVGLPSTAWTLWVVGVMLLAVLTGVTKRPVAGGVWLAAALFGAIGVVSSSGATINSRGHWMIGAQLLVFMLLSAWAAHGIFRRSPKALRWSAIALLLSQSVSSSAALVQAFGISVGGFAAVDGRSPGFSGHPNILGMVAGVAVVICAYLVITDSGPRATLLSVAFINVGGLIASGSVSSLIAFILGMLVLLVGLRVRLRIPVFIGVVSYGALNLVSQLSESLSTIRTPLDRIRQVTGQSDKISTWDVRQSTFDYAWQGILEDPFLGVGLTDSDGVTFNQTTITHNVLLRSWFQGGLGLGIAFFILYALFAGMLMRSVLQRINALPAAMLTVVASFSLTSAALQQEYYWMLLAGAWALMKTPSRSVFESPSRSEFESSSKAKLTAEVRPSEIRSALRR